jgi:hypothetical protein
MASVTENHSKFEVHIVVRFLQQKKLHDLGTSSFTHYKITKNWVMCQKNGNYVLGL